MSKTLCVFRITRDASKNIVSKISIDRIAALIDKNARTAEVIDVNTIKVDFVNWNDSQGTLQVQYFLGGISSVGQFVKAPEFQPAMMTVSKNMFPNTWTKYNLDEGPPSMDSIKQMMLELKAVTTAGQKLWSLNDLEAEDNPTKSD